MIKQVVLDADDFSPKTHVVQDLELLKSHIPNFKITLFSNSADKGVSDERYKVWTEAVSKYDWIEIAQHGYEHAEKEFVKSKRDMKKLHKKIQKKNKKIGMKPVKVFRAPFWQMSKEAYEFMTKKDYVVCTDRNQPRPNIPGMVQYRWNWSFESEIPDYEILKGHGHVTPESKNFIPACLENLKKLPQDAEYLFVSEYVERYGSD